MAEAGIGSREGKGPALREGPAERHSMSLQMGYTPVTVFPRKCSKWHLPAFHLARYSCESVPGSFFRCPPGTEFLQKCSRCLFLPSTWHGFPAKVFQVSFPAVHLARFSCKSVPGVSSCRPPGTEFLQKCSRCPFPLSTCHGNLAQSVG